MAGMIEPRRLTSPRYHPLGVQDVIWITALLRQICRRFEIGASAGSHIRNLRRHQGALPLVEVAALEVQRNYIGGGIAADTGNVSSDDGRRSLARLGPIYFSRS